MAYDALPVTPALISWARERAGFSLDEAAAAFKAIEAWEAGRSSPTYPQLESMAEKFKVPVAVFFFPEPPNLPPISESFRTLPDEEFERLPRRIRYLVRKAKAFQIHLADLTGGRNPAPRAILRDLSFAPSVSIPDMARDVRGYVGVDLDEQESWSDTDAALKEWRRNLHDVGIHIFKDAFKENAFSGFCLYDPEFPLIYVNNSSAKSRQIFTLFHELAHLLFETSGVDALPEESLSRLHPDDRRIEVICNRFAAEFLVPEAAFAAAFAGLTATEESAAVLAQRFHVSREFIFRKFLDRGLITNDAYNAAADRWAAERKGAGSGGDYYNTTITYLGREYIELAFSQFHRNLIDQTQLAEALDVKPRNLGTLEEYFIKGAVA